MCILYLWLCEFIVQFKYPINNVYLLSKKSVAVAAMILKLNNVHCSQCSDF